MNLELGLNLPSDFGRSNLFGIRHWTDSAQINDAGSKTWGRCNKAQALARPLCCISHVICTSIVSVQLGDTVRLSDCESNLVLCYTC